MDIFQYHPIVQEIDIAYREHYQPLEMMSHSHNDYEVIFVADGKVEFTIDNKTYIAEKDNMLFINSIEYHEYKVLQYPYKRYVIMMKPHFIHSINNPLLTSILHHRPEHYSHLIRLKSNAVESVLSPIALMLQEFQMQKPLWESSIKFMFFQLLISLYRISKDYFPLSRYENTDEHKYKTIIEIQKYIDSNYTQNLTLTELSGQFHIDRYYLCHLFKEITGYTFKSHLLMQRISAAMELLCQTNDNITDIGFNVGFNNASHFIQTFKKYVGMTPFQYKKDHSGSDAIQYNLNE